jgi:hypothetical protein
MMGRNYHPAPNLVWHPLTLKDQIPVDKKLIILYVDIDCAFHIRIFYLKNSVNICLFRVCPFQEVTPLQLS